MMIKRIIDNPVYFLFSVCLVLTPITGCGGGTEAALSSGIQEISIPLANASFEEKNSTSVNCASGWGCEMHVDPTSFRFSLDTQFAIDGGQSLLIERIKPEVYGLVFQQIRVADYIGRRMIFKAYIRMEGVSENGGGILYRVGGILNNMRTDFLTYDKQLILGAPDWKQLKMEFTIPPNARILTIGAILEGSGKMWVDNISLSVAP